MRKYYGYYFIDNGEVALHYVSLMTYEAPIFARAVGVLYSSMMSGWVVSQAAKKSLSGLYLISHKV